MKKYFVIFTFLSTLIFSHYSAFSQIILSEIMFDPDESEYYYEFIEIYNLSETDSVDLSGWQISDGTDVDQIIASDMGIIMAPNQFGIILDPGYFENERIYDHLIPAEALILTIDGSTFGSGGLSNSNPEKISIIDATGETVSSYTYSIDNPSGYSDEKIDLAGLNTADNWMNSQLLHGTPGATNSVTPKNFDVSVRLTFEPTIPQSNSNVTILGTIKNEGINPASELTLTFYVDRNRDSIPTAEEMFAPPISITETILSGDSLIKTTYWENVSSGAHPIIAHVHFDLDQDTTNNIAIETLAVSFRQMEMLINEIMYRPVTGGAEWIELYNPTDQNIDLNNWKFTDSHITEKTPITGQTFVLNAGDFIILSENDNIFNHFPAIPCTTISFNNNFPTLNNNDDSIVLYDLTDTIIDQVDYRSTWGNEYGVSLERRRPLGDSNNSSNWASSIHIAGGTPGEKNSVSPLDFDLAIDSNDIRFSPLTPTKGSNVTIHAKIRNVGINAASNFQVGFYFDRNIDSTIQSNEIIDSFFEINDTLAADDSLSISQKLYQFNQGINQIIVKIDYMDDQKNDNNIAIKQFAVPFTAKQIVINEVMFNSTSPRPEWIELYNASDSSIDLLNWKYSDSNIDDRVEITRESILIEPNSYAIVTKNENITAYYPEISVPIIEIAQWQTLNNDFDVIVLYDLTGTTIDSMVYYRDWNNKRNISLERFDYLWSSTDSSNWDPSIHPLGATPGAYNSISPLDFDLELKSLDYNPELPNPGESVIVTATVLNVGRNTSPGFNMAFFNDLNKDSVLEFSEQIKNVLYSDYLQRYDKVQISISYDDIPSGAQVVYAVISSEYDLNATNDSTLTVLDVRFNPQSLVINEIMYLPSSQQPEWIELYNPSDFAIDLLNWKISDSDVETKNVISNQSIFIEADSYIIVAQNATLEDYYPDIKVPIIALDQWSTLNNDFDAVVLGDLTNTTIDSMVYYRNWNNKINTSLERIDYLWQSTDSTSWAPCQDLLGATPGAYNSVSPFDFDLALEKIYFNNETPNSGETITVTIVVENVGRKTVEGFSAEFFNDVNKDSVLESGEEISGSINYSQLLQRYNNVKISIEWDEIPSGVQHVYAVISSGADLNLENDIKMARLDVGFQPQTLVINEIMYAPFSDQPEWIELYNRSNSTINFQDWNMSDSDTSELITLCSKPFYVESDAYVVISADSLAKEIFPNIPASFLISRKFPSLHNSSDCLYLYDLNKNMIDHVQYHSNWGGGEGISLERINPNISSTDSSNWNSCVDIEGGTPGRGNSIFIQKIPSSTVISVSPNPFSPDADGFEDVTIISYKLPMKTSTINLKIYDVQGRLMRFLCNNRLSGAENSIVWDGKDDDGNLCRIGIYIIYLEALNAMRGLIVSHKKTVVLAAKL